MFCHLGQWKKASPYQLFCSEYPDGIFLNIFEPQTHSWINYTDQEASWSDPGYVARSRIGADVSKNMDQE